MARMSLVLFFAAWSHAVVGGGAPGPQAGRVVGAFVTGRDHVGPVSRAVFDQERGIAYLATRTALHEVRGDKLLPIGKRPHTEARLLAAPGGSAYAWLFPHPQEYGFFAAELNSLPNRAAAPSPHRLKGPRGVARFLALYLGFQGKIILTAAPLENREGFTGPFLYTFWDRKGGLRERLELPSRKNVILDPAGDAVLLLGRQEATVYAPDGSMIMKPVLGHFRNGAVAAKQKLLLLNPADARGTDQIHVVKIPSGDTTRIEAPNAVHLIRIAPDRPLAVVNGRQGAYSYLDLKGGELSPGPKLPVTGAYSISDMEFLDRDRLTFGIIRRKNGEPKEPWTEGIVLVMTRNEPTPLRLNFAIREPTASVPAVDAGLGGRYFAGYTEENAVLVRFE